MKQMLLAGLRIDSRESMVACLRRHPHDLQKTLEEDVNNIEGILDVRQRSAGICGAGTMQGPLRFFLLDLSSLYKVSFSEVFTHVTLVTYRVDFL